MSLTQKIAQNTLWQILGRGTGLLFSLISLGLITRYLGQAGFGNYTTVFAFLQLFSIMADFGLTLMAVQMISEITEENIEILKEKTNNLFSNIFTLRLVLAFVILSIAPIAIWFFPYPIQVKYGVLIASVGFLFISLVQILQAVFQKNLQMNKMVIAEVASKLFFLLSVYAVTIKNWNLYGVLAFQTIGNLIFLGLMYYWSQQFVKLRLTINLPIWKKILSRSWPIALSIIFNLLYLKTDVIILSLYAEQSAVGLYGAAYRLIDVLTTFPYMFVGLILPILSAAWAQENKERFIRILQKSFDALTIVAIPMTVGTFFLAKPIMITILGPEFENAGAILKILIIALGMIYLGNIFTHSIIAINKQRQIIWAYLFVGISSLAGYFYFIPKYSYWGAAGVTVYSETAVAIITFVVVSKTLNQWPKLHTLFKSIIAGSAMGAVLWFSTELNLFINIIIGAIVYLGVMLLIKGIDKEMVREVLKMKSKKID